MRPSFILLAILLLMAAAIGICSYLGIVVVIRWSLSLSIDPSMSFVTFSTWKLSPHYYPFMESEEEEVLILEMMSPMSETAQQNASREKTAPPPTSTLSPCEQYELAIAIAKENEEAEASETELLVDIFGERAWKAPSPTTTPSYSPCEEYLRSIEEEKAIAEAKEKEEAEAKAIAEAIAIAKEKNVSEERAAPSPTTPWNSLPSPLEEPFSHVEWIRAAQRESR